MFKFDIEKFKDAAKGKLEIDAIEEVKELDMYYIYFKNSKLKYIKAPKNYKEEFNCINVYYNESSKGGYGWNGELYYPVLVYNLLKFEKGEV